MNLVGGLALYFVIWWITLFAVLPFGIRSQEEAGDVVAGTEPGAPVLPGLLKKAIITSLIAAVIVSLLVPAKPDAMKIKLDQISYKTSPGFNLAAVGVIAFLILVYTIWW